MYSRGYMRYIFLSVFLLLALGLFASEQSVKEYANLGLHFSFDKFEQVKYQFTVGNNMNKRVYYYLGRMSAFQDVMNYVDTGKLEFDTMDMMK